MTSDTHRHDHGHHGHGPNDHDHAGHVHYLPPEAGANRTFALGAALNLIFVGAEALIGVFGNSVALLADAGHNLSDVLGLLIAWGASVLVRRNPTPQYTYGLRSSSILAALLNAIILLIAVGGIATEAIDRLLSPEPVASGVVMLVAAIGILVNGFTAYLFSRSNPHDLNRRAVFLHMASDAIVSAAIVMTGAVILATNWFWLDPAVSLVVAVVIVIGTWRLLRDSVNMALHGVPAGIDPDAVREYLEHVPGVAAVHDLHIWPMSTTETALTCHFVVPSGHPGDQLLASVAQTLKDRFGIGHATIQVETGDPAHPCVLVPDHVV